MTDTCISINISEQILALGVTGAFFTMKNLQNKEYEPDFEKLKNQSIKKVLSELSADKIKTSPKGFVAGKNNCCIKSFKGEYLMKLKMETVRPEHFEDCCDALRDSLLGRTYFINEERLHTLIREGIDRQEIRVAKDETGQVLGFIYFTFGGAFYSFPYVRVFAVKKEFRSRGVGSFLLDRFEDQSRERKAGKVFLTVGEFNHRAKKLYERRGYVEVARIQDLFNPGYAEHMMMKVLGLPCCR